MSLPIIGYNTYHSECDLFVGGSIIKSAEGTTQGDPLAMAMYAVATIPLIKQKGQQIMQAWYADDAAGVGSLTNVRDWWDKIVSLGPAYGYHASGGSRIFRKGGRKKFLPGFG